MKRSLVSFAFVLVACGARTPLPDPAAREGEIVQVKPEEVQSIAVGNHHACAAKGDGSVFCWGGGDVGQLGDGKMTSSSRPVAVSKLGKAVEVAAGGRHSCARLSDGTVHCWGSRALGQTGDGEPLTGSAGVVVPTPVPAVGISSASSVVAGDGHTCAITGGAVQCFGTNDFGELGNEDGYRSSAAVRVHGAGSATAIALGAAHACMRAEDGGIRCWGSNEYGQLGVRATDVCGSFECSRRAVVVDSIGPAKSVAAGASRTCAILEDDSVSCWGSRLDADSATPKRIEALPPVTQVAIGAAHVCALGIDGTVWCFGGGSHGQLGYAVDTPCPRGAGTCSATPRAVVGLPKKARAIAAGGDSTCAVLVDGTAWCWGRNDSGQLGDGTTEDRAVPKQVLL